MPTSPSLIHLEDGCKGFSREFETAGVLITSKSLKFEGVTEPYVVKLPKSTGARHWCPKIWRLTGIPGICANSSPESSLVSKRSPIKVILGWLINQYTEIKFIAFRSFKSNLINCLDTFALIAWLERLDKGSEACKLCNILMVYSSVFRTYLCINLSWLK